ncbi:MAG: PEP-CTERM sorting domain-containing protein [Planctomycetota bacterium]
MRLPDTKTLLCTSALLLAGASAYGGVPLSYEGRVLDLVTGDFAPSEGAAFRTLLTGVADGGVSAGSTVRTRTNQAPIGLFPSSGAWYDDGTTRVQIGLDAPEYRNEATGEIYNTPVRINAAGQLIGTTRRYTDAGGDNGQDAWRYDGTTLSRIGLTGIGYENTSTGERWSQGYFINSAGVIAGSTKRYDASNTWLGYDTWMRDAAGNTQLVGVRGPDTLGPDDWYFSAFVEGLSDNGVVAGRTIMFGTNRRGGPSLVWVDDNGALATSVGLTGPDYEEDGNQQHDVYGVTANGTVVGRTLNFNASGSQWDRWVYQGGILTPITPLQDRFVGNDLGEFEGYTEDGKVFFWQNSVRLDGTLPASSPVVYEPGTGLRRLGLIDEDHLADGTSSATGHSSIVLEFNQAGQSIGTSSAYVDNVYVGYDAWFDDGKATTRIPLTAGWEQRTMRAIDMNDAGQVIGTTFAESGLADPSKPGWFYDHATGVSTALLFSTDNNGFGETKPMTIDDDGTVYGSYQRFDNGIDLGTSLFSWSLTDGFTDLFHLIEGVDPTTWTSIGGITISDDGVLWVAVSEPVSQFATNGRLIRLEPIFTILGDLNGDGVLDDNDINPFVQALVDPTTYAATFAELNPDDLGDFNNDGVLSNLDIFGFVNALTGGEALSAEQATLFEQANLQYIPEPGSLVLFGLTGLMLSRRKQRALSSRPM